MIDILERALNDLVPSFVDEQPDWENVRDRAGRQERRSPRFLWRHPRRSAAFALALVLIAVVATPAFGVGDYVLHLLERKNVSFVNSPSAPNVVKKQFLDLSQGAAWAWNPHVKAAQARVVGTFSVGGHPRKLWVAPTNNGGYCYAFEEGFGGCRDSTAERKLGRKGQFGVTWMGGSPRRGVPYSVVTRVGGDISAPTAAKVTATYADGTSSDIPFVWVSAPIAAGFFVYDIPTAHWSKKHRLTKLTLYARSGQQLGEQDFPVERLSPRAVIVPRYTQPSLHQLPTAPPAAPTAPIQEGTGDGFHVVVGHNGAVEFSELSEPAVLRGLGPRDLSFNCFRVTREFGILTVRGDGSNGELRSRMGFMLRGIGGPVDGCQIEAPIGRRWPDRLHNQAAVEVPLTAVGRRFFADRAAARDLALFVRSRQVHAFRKEPSATAKSDILRAYGAELETSPIRIQVVNATTLRFSERSTTGRVFSVDVEHGRISSENLKPYAFVF